MKKFFKNLLPFFLCAFFIFNNCIPTLAASIYLAPEPRLSNLYLVRIRSFDNLGGEVIETFTPPSSFASTNEITTTKEHYRDNIEIRYWQEGYATSESITLEGGTKLTGYTYGHRNGINSNGQVIVVAWGD